MRSSLNYNVLKIVTLMNYSIIKVIGLLTLATTLLSVISASQSQYTLMPTDDTFVNSIRPTTVHDGKQDGNMDGYLQVRSYLETGSDPLVVRAIYTYIRFDLSGYGDITNARFQLTQSNSLTWEGDQVKVYGLPDNNSGFTTQDWEESSLTFNSTGDELVPSNLDNSMDPLLTDSLEDLGFLKPENEGQTDGGMSPGDIATLETGVLNDFLIDRAGNSVTLIVANVWPVNRTINFYDSSNTTASNRPMLTFNGTYSVPESNTYSIIVGLLAFGFVMVRRRLFLA